MNLFNVEAGTIKKIGFKKEMTNIEIYGIEAIINKLHEDEALEFDSEELGLAYTSNTDHGTLNACNGVGTHEQYEISHFALLADGRLVMVCYDTAENEQYYIVE